MTQPTPATPPTASPPQRGRDALQNELDATWRQMNQPKTTARQMSALYARAAELRRIISTLENSPNGN